MFLADDVRVKDPRGGLQRIYGGINAQFGDLTAEHRGGVEVGECGGGSGVGQVVGRHVDRLHGGDGAVFGGGDALLHLAHLGGKGRLVAHGRGHTSQEGGYLGAGLGETEDVVDEQQDVPALPAVASGVPEGLGHGQTGEGHRETGSGRLVHLTEYQCGLGLGHLVVVHLREVPVSLFHAFLEFIAVADDSGLDHLAEQVVALAGTLAHTGEDREAVVALGDIVD